MKYLLGILGILLFVSCSSDDTNNKISNEKENYITSNLSNVLNLDKSEIDEFKKSMKFNEEGKLVSWDSTTLEKVYNDDDYAIILNNIFIKMEGKSFSSFIIVDKDGNERKIKVKSNIIEKNIRGRSSDEEYLDFEGDGEKTILYDQKKDYITGSCVYQKGSICY